ncbi:HdeD family acid-resistance protein [Streptomyces sp. 8N616]|uniref:HdeD family acid-resistance protein n=1 Tax=Streptomyces sp. 8N616 TaxID=3457414 RepID=UPI003FCF78FA
MAVPPDAAPERGADPQEILGALGGSWLWALGFALATLLPGILVLVWPAATLHVPAVIVGLHLLVAGGFRFVTAFSRDGDRGGGRATRVLVAVVAVLAGVLSLRHPLQTIAAVSLIVGASWLLSGLLTAFVAIADRDLTHRGLTFAAGALGFVAGIVVLGYPVESAVALARLLGLWLVLLGVVEWRRRSPFGGGPPECHSQPRLTAGQGVSAGARP